jgi:Putative zinc-finger
MSTGWPTPPAGGGFDTHLDEELSAYLDGELDPVAAQQAYQHLSTCADCRSRLDAISQVRTMVRTAPPVEPPFGFIERLVKERRRRPFAPVIGAAVGLAAVWLLVLGLVAAGPVRVEPPVDDIAVAQAGFDGGTAAERGDFEANDINFAAADDEEIPANFRPPDEAAGADFDAGFEATNRDGWLAMYDDDGAAIAVYQQMGEYRVGSLPGGGEAFEIDGSRAWRSSGIDGRNAIVVQRGAMTYTLVAEVDVDDLIDIAEDLPEREAADTSWVDRLQDAIDRFLEAFSLGI